MEEEEDLIEYLIDYFDLKMEGNKFCFRYKSKSGDYDKSIGNNFLIYMRKTGEKFV